MKFFAAMFFALFPAWIQTPLRRLFGARVDATARVRFGTILYADEIEIGSHANIGPFALIRARRFVAGAYAEIRPFSLLRATSIIVGSHAHIASTVVVSSELTARSRFALGDHSRLGPFCWIEPGEGIDIGKQTGIGGHTLIFTHAVWADYLNGGQVVYGPVKIEDDVWIAWRSSILANVTIGKNAMIAVGTVVNKSVPPGALAVGVPARILNGVYGRGLSDAERLQRAQRILEEYRAISVKDDPTGRLGGSDRAIAIDDYNDLRRGDILFALNRRLSDEERQSLFARGVSVLDYPSHQGYVVGDGRRADALMEFLRRYGVRFYRSAPGGSSTPTTT